MKTALLDVNQENRKRIIFFAFLSIFLAFAFTPIFSLPIIGDFGEALSDMVKDMLGKIIGGSLVDNSLRVFTNLPSQLSQTQGAWAVVETINTTVIRPVACTLIGLCFAIRLAQYSTDIERLISTPDRLISPFMQAAMCMFLAGESWNITQYIIRMGAGLGTTIYNQSLATLGGSSIGLGEELLGTVKLGMFQALGLFFKLLLPYVIYLIISLITKIAVYGVIIEILVRAAMFPLFLGDVMLHGFEGRGFGIFKGFLAACCQGAVFILISAVVAGLNLKAMEKVVNVTNVITQSGDLIGNIFLTILYSAAGLTMMLKSSELVKDIFGAR